MNEQIRDVSLRIRSLREDMGISVAEMAGIHGLSETEYLVQEGGERDFTFTFLYLTAQKLGVDMTDLITGRTPTLTKYTVVRKGRGLSMERRTGFTYHNLAHRFLHRTAEPFLVEVPASEPHCTIALRSHNGQEFDYVLEGTLRFQIGETETVLREGDSVYYDSGVPHGMVAEGSDCTFLAMVLRDGDGGKMV